MIKTTVQQMAEPIGFEIGTSDDFTQSALLNGFCKGLNNSIIQSSNLDMQLCYIANKLTPNSEEVLIKLVEFIKTKD